MTRLTLALLMAGFVSMPASADQAALRQEMEVMRAQLKAMQTRLDAMAVQQEKGAESASATQSVTKATDSGAPPLATGSPQTTIGGYGELTYNRYSRDSRRTQADLNRFVLFFGHAFDERLSFHSEVEWEHAVTSSSDRGESEIEQAYINYKLTPNVSLKTGLFLMPFGFINQYHEPPVYYGVLRNEVETRIIPSTWREGGVGLYGSTESGFAWDVGITTGFDFSKFDDPAAPLRAIHQELQLAKAANLASYAALNYRGVPGLTVGGAVFTGNSGHNNSTFRLDNTQPNFAGVNGRVTLWDLHARWQKGGWDLQTVYARGSIGNADKIDRILRDYNNANATNRAYLPSEFYGWLAQAARTVWRRGDMTLTPFVRFEQYNTQSKMPEGFDASSANADRVATIGLSFRPHPQVVFKADYQKYLANTNNDRFNLGVGYMF